MISIDTKYLTQAARFVSLRKPPDECEGEQSLSRHTFFAWTGDGSFTVNCGDNVFFYLNRFPANGTDTAWSTALLSDDARRLLTRTTLSAGFTQYTAQENRRIGLDRAQDGSLRVQTPSFEGQFPCRRFVNPFPVVNVPAPGDGWSRTNYFRLYDSLDFLSQGCGRDDPFDRSQECAIFPDGKALGFHGITALATAAPQLPFEMKLRRRHARRVVAWLRVLKGTAETLTQVDVAQFRHVGPPYYCIRNIEGTHAVCLPASTGTTLRQIFEEAWAPAVTFQAEADGRALAARSELAALRSRDRLLTCTVRTESTGNRWALHLETEDEPGSVIIKAQHPLTMISPPPAGSSIAFRLKAGKLNEALRRIATKKIVLVYREENRYLSLFPHEPSAVYPDGYQRNECLLKVIRPEAPPAAPIEPSQPG